MDAWGFATLLWILLFVVIIVCFTGYFTVARADAPSEVVSETITPEEVEKDTKYPLTKPNTLVDRFASPGSYNFEYIDVYAATYYLLSLSDTCIRCVEITTPGLKLTSETPIDTIASYSRAQYASATVPIEMYSNNDMYMERACSVWEYVKYRLFQLLSLILYFTPALLIILAVVRIILCFYTPLAHFEETHVAERMVRTHFSLSLLICIFSLLLLLNIYYRRFTSTSTVITATVIMALMSFLCMILAIYLLSLSRDNSTTTGARNSISQLFCECADASRRLTATADYHFECTDSDGCDGRCGICADIFYAPLVLYSVFTVAYLLSILYLTIIHFFYRKIFYFDVPSFKCAQHTVISLHGSRAYGYPLYTKLPTATALEVNKLLTDMRSMQSDKRDLSYLSYLYPSARGVRMSLWRSFVGGIDSLFE